MGGGESIFGMAKSGWTGSDLSGSFDIDSAGFWGLMGSSLSSGS